MTIPKARQWIAFSSLGAGMSAITSDGTGMEVFEWGWVGPTDVVSGLLDEMTAVTTVIGTIVIDVEFQGGIGEIPV